MKRTLYKHLLNWKNSSNRKPLLLQGARQVGKTYLVEEFGRREYADFVYLNFEQKPGLTALFNEELDPESIIDNIGLYLGRKINSESTLIFFDEIQVAPEALTSLKYFYEQCPGLHIIAAGSLLGVTTGKQSAFPVGKVNFLTMVAMTFTEYLSAFGEALLVEKLEGIKEPEPLPAPLHKKLIKHLKLYLFLGGMPEALQDFLDNRDVISVRRIQNEILEAYKRDFSKYTTGNQAIKTVELWHSIPRQLAKENKKFKYGDVRKKARAATFEQTIEWLKSAGLINVANNITVPKLPLSGYTDFTKFKIYLHDTGLLGAMLNIPSGIIVEPGKIFSEYNGVFIENYVAQELMAGENKELYYWTSKSEAEVDFILQKNSGIYPLEVKSGTGKNIRSLRSYDQKYSPELIYRISPRNFVKSGNFVNIPLYAAFLMGKEEMQIR
jgi:predicted AAA+ superfamily ATPase